MSCECPFCLQASIHFRAHFDIHPSDETSYEKIIFCPVFAPGQAGVVKMVSSWEGFDWRMRMGVADDTISLALNEWEI